MMDVSGKGKVLIALGFTCIFFVVVSYQSVQGRGYSLTRPALEMKRAAAVPCIPAEPITKTITKTVIKTEPAKQTKPIPPFKTRLELATILNREQLEVGVELGVQRGLFAKHNLRTWRTCKKYVLVDLWAHQSNYKDTANFATTQHEQLKREALANVAPFKDKYEVCQNFTTICAQRYENSTFDFVYVDARHDYKGVQQDLEAWYPLLKPGGIFAGHDYVTNDDGPRQHGQDWSLNFDGTRDPTGRAVKGAVDDFAAKYGLHLSVSYREKGWNTWAARKPY